MIHSFNVDGVLINKYNQPVPRYTSYPTVPYWKEELPVESWEEIIQNEFANNNSTRGISLYIHLPFCESLCTYCGCNKKITTNHKVEDEYISAIEKEWKLYTNLMSEPPVIREIHLGGGTPTFFSPQNLEKLLNIILTNSTIHPLHQFSIEGHPNNTTLEQLQVLYAFGFRRISYGVQDNDPKVQRIINRIQPLENVKNATINARQTGFTSVNFDLIYGLPLQTIESIERTIHQVTELMPDRIAFYSYAHVPWTSKSQRLFDEIDLPAAEEKIALYLKGKEILLNKDYADIGMDHFALPQDELYKARRNGKLHRNFMGYTTQNTGMLIGLGVSAISDAGSAYAQNEKTIHDYYAAVNEGRLPVKKGHILNKEEIQFRKNILDISCKGFTSFQAEQFPLLQKYSFPELELLAADGLVEYDTQECKLTEKGLFFIRNICSAFDLNIQRNKTSLLKPLFSNAI